ncbi:MAG: chromosomal replication initiator protein DnaA [Cyclobacteriaceae bacterium]|nr:chromosomal replication initiator protein DnaA [Cyclobacteriaceae bacterium]MCH8517263.1 chromosomal replication initiator protein DnaA [Cyclobacteriaceae bacterium]
MGLSHEKVWENCLRIIREDIGEQAYRTWFLPIKPMAIHGDKLTIQVPSEYFYDYLEEHYVHVLKKAVVAEIGPLAKLEYSVIVDQGGDEKRPTLVQYPTQKAPYYSKKNPAPEKPEYKSPFDLRNLGHLAHQSYLNPKYTFDNYIEGTCNQLARSAGLAIAEKPGITSFNPLMIYGTVGLGKTHLVQAIGNEVKNNDDNKFVVYVTSENFTNQVYEALKNRRIEEFNHFYLQVDILIIDDIQFLAGKERTQEILFHIFNQLHGNGKQIVFTSDRPPRDLMNIELQDRLISRFKWGLTADITSPDLETRVAIIQKKLEDDGIEIPTEVIEYVAHTVDTSVRDLEGVIISLIGHASLTRKNIDLELAKQTLKNIVKEIDTEVDIDFIQKTVADYFKLKVDDLVAKTRKKEMVKARQIAMYFCKSLTDHSLKSIGFNFGGRDHTTVIHSVQSVEDQMVTNNTYKAHVDEIKKKLKIKKI